MSSTYDNFDDKYFKPNQLHAIISQENHKMVQKQIDQER
jgi:hypothetical protein